MLPLHQPGRSRIILKAILCLPRTILCTPGNFLVAKTRMKSLGKRLFPKLAAKHPYASATFEPRRGGVLISSRAIGSWEK